MTEAELLGQAPELAELLLPEHVASAWAGGAARQASAVFPLHILHLQRLTT